MSELNELIQNTIKHGLMSQAQYLKIIEILLQKAPCKLLVFGLGNDSYLWNKINKDGTSYFIEDNQDWIKKFNGLNKIWSNRFLVLFILFLGCISLINIAYV